MRNGPIINGGKAFSPSPLSVGGIGLLCDTLGHSIRLLRAQTASARLGTGFFWDLLALSVRGPVNDFPVFNNERLLCTWAMGFKRSCVQSTDSVTG